MIKTISQAIDDMAVSLGANPSPQIPTVSQALENVYAALGGTRTDLDTLVVSEVIDLLAPLIHSGGGGTTFPTFTENDDEWSCDLTYAQTYAVLLSDGMNDVIPCAVAGEGWTMAYYIPNGEEIQSVFEDIPETVNYGFRVIVGQEPSCFFADDGNIYAKNK